MGVFSWLFSGADEAAAAGAKGADDAVSFADDPFHKRMAADFSGRVADGSNPRAVTEAATGNFAKGSKYLAAGGATATGLWAGGSAAEAFAEADTQESKEMAYEEFLAAVEAVKENDDLDPEEKDERIQQLRETYERAVGEATKSALANLDWKVKAGAALVVLGTVYAIMEAQ